MPAGEAEFFEVSTVASNISAAFILPEIGSSCGNNSAVSAAVHMPETAVNKDDFFVFDQNDIRMTGQITAMKGITITHSMNDRTDDYFR
jgi:hypothetical protein